MVEMANSGEPTKAEDLLRGRTTADLLFIAKQLGVSFPKSKPSATTVRSAIMGKVKESLMLSRHDNRI
jgi:hypothetical protein